LLENRRILARTGVTPASLLQALGSIKACNCRPKEDSVISTNLSLDSLERRSRSPNKAHVVLRENGLSLVLLGLFLLAMVGQIAFGLGAYNEERVEQGRATVTVMTYLTSGHFLEALFENWESEFLQMGLFVVLSAALVQKGSAESKPLDEPFEGDEDPRDHRSDEGVPWPVRRGGWVLWLYERSLATAFAALFVLSFVLHAIGGLMQSNEERMTLGLPAQSLSDFVSSSQFWFESFQNWQSEFLAVFSIVALTIFLRYRGSPQSKPVAAPHSKTGG
jgi:hypothetical protein